MEVMKVYTSEDVYNYANDGDIDNLRLALDYCNNSVNWYRNKNGLTALLAAAREGHNACIGVLLDRGADINSKQNQDGTSLMIAAHQGHTTCIGLLLDRGADIDSKDNKGATALHIAADQGHTACISVLLDRGADIESKENHGFIALHGAAIFGHIASTRLLLDRGADIESKTLQGFTAVLLAARRGHIQCTRLLLDRQAIIPEKMIDTIQHQETKKMILDEILHRLRRASFDTFINHHIEYSPLIHNIYSTCYPSGDLRVASPAIGWDRAEAVRNKYYFDEVLFYVHVYVALVCTRSKTKQSASSVTAASQCREQLASSSDKTSTLMTVLSSYLTEYLIPEQIKVCGKCHGKGILKCSRCKKVFYCSADCQRMHWHTHKLTCSK